MMTRLSLFFNVSLRLPARWRVWIPLSIFLLLARFSASAQCNPRQDSLELVKLYDATNGDQWLNSLRNDRKWKVVGTPVSSWYGVSLNTNGCVKTLQLISNQLSGSIPNFNLPNLNILYLNTNQLSGNIQNFNFPNLNILDISFNQLSGNIPNFNFPNLQEFKLYSNQLSGNIPNFNFPNLQQFDLTSNQLSGNIPNFNFPNLQTLRLSSNQLSGNIPNFNFPNLQQFSISWNQLSGNIPNFNLPNLNILDISNNQLSGNIPNFNFPNLQNLELNSNQLSGNIPNFNLPNLNILHISNNQLSGSLPNFNLPELKGMYLGNNQLSGQIPNLNLPKLQDFYAYSNRFTTSTLPNFTLPELLELDLSDCLLNTPLINFTGLPKLQVLYLYLNQLTGAIPSFNLPNLKELRLEDNRLSNTLPELNVPLLTDIRVQNNLLTGCFPASYRQFCTIPSVTKRNFSGNTGLPNNGNFTAFCSNNAGGCIVVDTSSCRYKDSLALADVYRTTNGQNWTPKDTIIDGIRKISPWNLSQPMTNWWGVGLNTAGCVDSLYLDGKYPWGTPIGLGLSGRFPTALCRLSELLYLNLRGNSGLSGTLPDSIQYLKQLRFLYLDNCSFTSPLPNSLQLISTLREFFISNNPLQTTLPSFLGNLKKVEGLIVENSGVTGSIPPAIGQIDSLTRFLIDGNTCLGIFPATFSNRTFYHFAINSNRFDSLPRIRVKDYGWWWFGQPFFQIQNNRLTFDDIVPNLVGIPSTFYVAYAPQDSIFKDTTITARVGDPLSINLNIDGALTTNSYKWFKNGAPFRTPTNSNTLIFTNLQTTDAGVYTCEVTNPNAPQLTLYSRKITIVTTPNTSCRYLDSLELVKFYIATDSANWRPIKWNLNASMNTWQGVYFNQQNCVYQLSLSNNNLGGSLPTDMGNLLNLELLYLNDNHIGGQIPASLGLMTNLQNLELSYNKFIDTIPPSLGNLTKLQTMYVRGNDSLRGKIPTSFGNLTNMVELMLTGNQLSDTIPRELGNLIKIKKLLLNDNKLTGVVPSSLGNLLQAKSLQFAKNQLTGVIPPSFRNLSNLVCLGFNNNFIDSVPNLSNINGLDTGCLQTNNNRLTFDDILPNLRTNPRFDHTYEHQDSIFQNITYTKNVGETLTINLGIDGALTSNKYVWFKNGIRFDSSNQNTLILRGLSTCDAGTYTCEVTNPNAPLLTLKSRIIKVIVNGSLPTNRLDTTLCYGQNYRLPNNQIVNTTTNFRDTIKNIRRCDSLIRLVNVVFTAKPDSIVQNATICSGQNYTLPNGQIVAPLATITYRDTLKTTGCDSRYRITNITVNPKPSAQIIGLNSLYCRENVLVNLQGQPTGGTFKIDATIALNFTPSVLSLGNHTISYIYRASNACSDTAIQTIRVADAARNAIIRTICSGESITINGKVYNQNRRTGIDTLKNRAASGCDSIITVQITINQKVNALDDDIILPKDTTKALINVLINDIYPANLFEVKLLQRPLIGTIQDLNNGVFKLEVPTATKGTAIFTYQLCALNCPNDSDSATVRVQIKGTGDDLDPISTGVTPNNDGKNDKLDLPDINWNLYPESEIEIYNRWQQKVYAAKPYKRDWAGQSTEGVDLPTGDYFIILRLSKADGKIIIGNVYLAR